jgi:hypothetical protein
MTEVLKSDSIRPRALNETEYANVPAAVRRQLGMQVGLNSSCIG